MSAGIPTDIPTDTPTKQTDDALSDWEQLRLERDEYKAKWRASEEVVELQRRLIQSLKHRLQREETRAGCNASACMDHAQEPSPPIVSADDPQPDPPPKRPKQDSTHPGQRNDDPHAVEPPAPAKRFVKPVGFIDLTSDTIPTTDSLHNKPNVSKNNPLLPEQETRQTPGPKTEQDKAARSRARSLSPAFMVALGRCRPCNVHIASLEGAKIHLREAHTQLKKRLSKRERRERLEENSRQRGLAQSITKGKGFDLLRKMGWKPGQGAGKRATGILEPVKPRLAPNRADQFER